MGLSGRRFNEKGVNDNKIYILFSYSTRHLNKTDKIRFYYALKGRDGKSGFIARTSAVQLGKSVFLVPIRHDKEAADFLSYWKCKFERRKVMILDDDQN